MPITRTFETEDKKSKNKLDEQSWEGKREKAKQYALEMKKAFVEQIIEAAEKAGEMPWQSPNFVKFPKSLNKLNDVEAYNKKNPDKPLSRNTACYQGINVLILGMAMDNNGYTDSRWATYKEIIKRGGSLKGQHGTKIVYYEKSKPLTRKNVKTGEIEVVYRKDKNTGEYLLDEEGKKVPVMKAPVLKFPTVFNVQQAEGLKIEPEPPMRDMKNDEKCPEMESIIAHSEAPVLLDQGTGLNRFYSPGEDKVHLPPRDQFKSITAFYATAAHEIAHSTGHEKRLNRDLSGMFGSDSYAREELVAELTSVFLSQELDVRIPQKEMNNHAEYIKSWDSNIKFLKEKPEELFKVIGDAQKATDYIKLHMLEKELRHEQENKQVASKEKDDTVKKVKAAVKPKGIRRKKSSQELSR